MVLHAATGSPEGRTNTVMTVPNRPHHPTGIISTGVSPPVNQACRRIQVSREKRPLNFFVTLSKKFLMSENVIELSGLGLAVTTVVTVAEILRSQGFVYIEHINTCLVDPHPEGHANAPKAKIQIWIHKTPEFEELASPVHSHYRQGRHHGRSHTALRGNGQNHHYHHHYHHSGRNGNSNAGRAGHKVSQRHRLESSHSVDAGNTHRLSRIEDEIDIIEVGAERNVHLNMEDYISSGQGDVENDVADDDSDVDVDATNDAAADLLNEEDGADDETDEADVHGDGNATVGNTEVEDGPNDGGVSEKTFQNEGAGNSGNF